MSLIRLSKCVRAIGQREQLVINIYYLLLNCSLVMSILSTALCVGDSVSRSVDALKQRLLLSEYKLISPFTSPRARKPSNTDTQETSGCSARKALSERCCVLTYWITLFSGKLFFNSNTDVYFRGEPLRSPFQYNSRFERALKRRYSTLKFGQSSIVFSAVLLRIINADITFLYT